MSISNRKVYTKSLYITEKSISNRNMTILLTNDYMIVYIHSQMTIQVTIL